jgi:hypothetical protein
VVVCTYTKVWEKKTGWGVWIDWLRSDLYKIETQKIALTKMMKFGNKIIDLTDLRDTNVLRIMANVDTC